MNYYVDVILPLPLKGTFTYELSQDEFNKLEQIKQSLTGRTWKAPGTTTSNQKN